MNTTNKSGGIVVTTKVQKWGNSLAVRIPKELADKLNIEQGSDIEMKETNRGIEIIPKKRKPTLEELLSQITPENRHDEIDFGKPVGRELI